MLCPGGSPGRTPGLGDIAEGYWPRAPCWDPEVLAQPLQGGRVIWGGPSRSEACPSLERDVRLPAPPGAQLPFPLAPALGGSWAAVALLSPTFCLRGAPWAAQRVLLLGLGARGSTLGAGSCCGRTVGKGRGLGLALSAQVTCRFNTAGCPSVTPARGCTRGRADAVLLSRAPCSM